MASNNFQFKKFEIQQVFCAMKVNTDSILLGAWSPMLKCKNVLDIGSGNGLISLMIAQRNPFCKITGVELDLKTVEESKINLKSSPWSERIEMFHSSIQEFTNSHMGCFDGIVSNPPFFVDSLKSQNIQRAYARHTLRLSHTELLKSVNRLLSSKGVFCIILPIREADQFCLMAGKFQLHLVKRCNIRPRVAKKINRVMLVFKRHYQHFETSELIIYQESSRKYSDDFQRLTESFYLDSTFKGKKAI